VSAAIVVALVLVAAGALAVGLARRARPSAGDAGRNVRIDAAELARLLAGERPPFVVDLRRPAQVKEDPFTVPGALRVDPSLLGAYLEPGREVVFFCT
jgi:hypothetical protein